jgi:hypothetical protein
MPGLGHETFETADQISQFRCRLIHFMQAAREIFQHSDDWIQSARCEYMNIHFVRHRERPETGIGAILRLTVISQTVLVSSQRKGLWLVIGPVMKISFLDA